MWLVIDVESNPMQVLSSHETEEEADVWVGDNLPDESTALVVWAGEQEQVQMVCTLADLGRLY